MKLTRATQRTIKKYGANICREAYELHAWGMGASGVAWSIPALNGNTNASDAAINAGRELAGVTL